MKTYLLTWNPNRWPWNYLTKMANQTARGEVASDRWSCVSKQVNPGDRTFLVMVGTNDRGIIASGWATSKPYPAKHWDKVKAAAGKTCSYVDGEWERLLDPQVDSPLLVTTLQKKLGRFKFKWTPQGGGIRIPEELADELEKLWAAHVGNTNLNVVDTDEEISAYEGDQRISVVRHRRREQKLRSEKLKSALKFGNGRLRCEVPGCSFDFEAVYGELGRNYAHVHHLKPLADRTKPSETKLPDLAIVCANCHAMIHRGGKCRPLDKLIP